jgi:hypothetical protein
MTTWHAPTDSRALIEAAEQGHQAICQQAAHRASRRILPVTGDTGGKMPKAMDLKRSFTVVHSSVGVTGGRYLSVTPYSAARKAAKVLQRARPAAERLTGAPLTYRMRETTLGSLHPTYSYEATVEAIDKSTALLRPDGRPLLRGDGRPVVIRRRHQVRVTRTD